MNLFGLMRVILQSMILINMIRNYREIGYGDRKSKLIEEVPMGREISDMYLKHPGNEFQ